MARVAVINWNPARAVLPGRLGRRIPLRKRVNNFGDLIGPKIVEKILKQRGLDTAVPEHDARLLTVGSILHLAKPGDVVWGSGVNGKKIPSRDQLDRLDVRAVRGPRTREYLLELGYDAPPVYGDPAMLMNLFWTREELAANAPRREVACVPNFNDFRAGLGSPDAIDPRSGLWSVIAQIAASDFVVGSSLHAIVVAETFGIPARLIRPGTEPKFKYDDYYFGTGRPVYAVADNYYEALQLGGEHAPKWSPQPLLDAFPADLWVPAAVAARIP